MKFSLPYTCAFALAGAFIVAGVAVEVGLSAALIGTGCTIAVSAFVCALERHKE
jgi:uncharacterized membrane protein